MPILNYTTSITVQKTAGEIQEILARVGARTVVIEYGPERIPDAISFQVEVEHKFVSYRLPSNWRGVHKALQQSNAERKFKTEDQARRVAWRIIKDLIEAEVATIEANVVDLPEVFLPYMVNPDTNMTLYEEFKAGFLLGPGDVVDGEVDTH